MSRRGYRIDILNCLANLSSDEVFTSPKLANAMLDLLPDEVWANPNLRWLDPCAKSGVYLREAARRLMVGLAGELPNDRERRAHIYEKMLFGIAITEVTGFVSRRTLYGCKEANHPKHSFAVRTGANIANQDGNIRFPNAEHHWVGRRCTVCGATKSVSARTGEGREKHAHPFLHLDLGDIFEGNHLKFDVIMGNPPYHLADSGHGKSAMPIYHLFVGRAKEMKPRYLTFVVPARWYAGGKGLDGFRSEMLRDQRISHLADFPDSGQLFDGVDLKGGACYFLWDSEHSGDCHVASNGDFADAVYRRLGDHRVFIRNLGDALIVEKVASKASSSRLSFLDGTVWASKPYGLRAHTVPSDAKDSPTAEHNVKLITREGVKYIKRDQVVKNAETINSWKVITSRLSPSAGGVYPTKDGKRGVLSGKTQVLPPGTACTETYLVVGTFETGQEAKRFLEYVQSRLFRFLMSHVVITQDVTRKCFAYVPNLPMDRNWSEQELYSYFDLGATEIDWIESKIKSMP